MSNQTERDNFFHLVERYLSGNATDKEKAFLEEYYQQHENNPGLLEGLTTDEKNEMETSFKESIYAQISTSSFKKQNPGLTVFIGKYKVALSAAAVLIILLGAAFIFTLNQRSARPVKVQPINNALKHDVAPGHDGAILTLANGKPIVLDSAHNGSLAIQGSTEVIKKDGQIVYNKINNPSEITYNTVHTPNGRQYSLQLADGTNAWLNAASSITFPTSFSGKERIVSITGEVYFEVAHNTRMPFIVEKGDMKIKVLGTHFNVNSYEDENSNNITLLEGSVEVTNENTARTIKPGQQVRLNRQGSMSVVNNVDIEEVMAWKNEIFKFKGTGVEVLMRQLSRWYDVEVVFNRKVNDRFFVEIPRSSNLSDVLKTLELTGRIRFEIEGKKIIVAP